MATEIISTVSSSRLTQAAGSTRPAETVRETGGHSAATPQQNPVQASPSQKPAQETENAQATLQEFQEELEEAVSNINDYVQNIQRSLQFTIAENSGRTIIKVIDSVTQEVIRQIPPEEALSISEQLNGNGGFILREKA